MLMKFSGVCALLVFAILASACKQKINCDGDRVDSDYQRYVIGEWLVDVDTASGSWEVRSNASDDPLMRSSVCVAGHMHSPISIAEGTPIVLNFTGSFRNLPKAMDRLRWRGISDERPIITYDDTLSITWKTEKKEAVSIGFRLHANNNLWVGVLNNEYQASTTAMSLDCRKDEAFFGLGAQTTGLNLRGRRYPLWAQEQGIGKHDSDLGWPLTNRREASYAPMGVWHSSEGYSAVIGHDSYSDIDLCSETDKLTLRSHKLLPSFVLVKGDSIKERITEVTEYVGRLSHTPPDWVFAPWNDAAAGQAWLEEVASQLRDNKIPSSVIWSEDWAGGEHTPLILKLTFNWDWDETTYPNLPNTIETLHEKGFAFLAYFNPFVSRSGDNWEYGNSNGLFIKNRLGRTQTFTDYFLAQSTMLDLTNPKTLDWLKENQMYAAQETGIDGWMADFAEWLPANTVLHSGQDPWIGHNQYPLQWQEANRSALAEAHDDNNWTFFVRSGWASINGGTAGVAPVLWAGDQNTDWSKGDGLASVIPIGAHAGMAGVALFGSDIAGYMSIPLLIPHTNKELFFRWVALGAFSPVMRTHHGTTNCGNWMFNSDDQTLMHYKRYAEIHTLLLPFFKNLTQEAQQLGWPLMRHPYLANEDDEGFWRRNDYLYFLGDNMLVAPVIEKRSEARELNLPNGYWWPLFGDQVLDTSDNDAVALQALATEIPVLIRGGTIIPLLGEVVDSFYGAEQGYGTDLDDIKGQYRLALYPDSEGSLQSITVEGATIAGTKWPADTSTLDWSRALWNNDLLPACSELAESTCYLENGIRLINVTDGVLSVGDAELTMRSDVTLSWRIHLGHHAWGELAKPTGFDLSAERTDNCDMIVGH